MKKYAYLFSIAACFFILSCGNNEQKQAPVEPGPAASSNLMDEGPAYDPMKIDPSAPVVELTLKAMGNSMADMSFDQKELRVKAGSTIHLLFINESTDGAMSHNFVLIDEGSAEKVGPEGMKAGIDNNFVPKMKQVLVSTKMTQPKEKTEITFPAPQKGTYDFICTYPGHYQKMNGKFIVI